MNHPGRTERSNGHSTDQYVPPQPGPLAYTIDEHQVRLGDGLRVVVDHPDCTVVEIDLATKRPEILPGSDSGDAVVDLYAGTETLGAADDSLPTVIRFPGRGDWHMIVDGGRYTVRICLYSWSAIL